MAIYSGLFNSVNGDRKYDAWWFALYFSRFIGNGVYPNPSTGLQVLENENMETVVKSGDGWINGYFIHSNSDHVLQHDLADGVLKRIDRVVMRLNYTSRQIEIEIKKGGFSSNPVAPSLQRDADFFELALADVLINNGATQITQANITDNRLNKELCGIVHGTVDQADMTTIFNQYQSWLKQITAEQEAEFNAWFDQLKDTLEGDVATALYLEIERAEKRARAYTDSAPEAMLMNMGRFGTVRSDKDEYGTFHIVKKSRTDDESTFRKSVFSNPNADGNPLIRTVTTYAEEGVTIIGEPIIFDIEYDEDGDWIREVPRK